MPKVTLNIGMVEGGLKTNMIPSECRLEADIRLPVGVIKARMREEVERSSGLPAFMVEEGPARATRPTGATRMARCCGSSKTRPSVSPAFARSP